jgi:hypothetical protein
MFAYSKKEYESIDPVELPPQITLTQARTGVGTDPILFTFIVIISNHNTH